MPGTHGDNPWQGLIILHTREREELPLQDEFSKSLAKVRVVPHKCGHQSGWLWFSILAFRVCQEGGQQGEEWGQREEGLGLTSCSPSVNPVGATAPPLPTLQLVWGGEGLRKAPHKLIRAE